MIVPRQIRDRLIVLAAGGTGGHVFPAEALAQALLGEGHRLALITDSRGRLWTIGVESDGDEERNATRQFISLGRFEDVHWSPMLAVTHPGAVYYPAAAPDRKGGLWLAWCEFDDRAQTWRVHTADFDGEKLTDAVTPRWAPGPQLRPAVIVEPDDRPLVTFESGEEHHFVLRAAKFV